MHGEATPATAAASEIGCQCDDFGSSALGRPLLEAGMVQTFPPRHIACVCLPKLLETGTASRRTSLDGDSRDD
jgi:hypothetical protein